MDLLPEFKAFLEAQDKPASPITIKNYLADLRSFFRWYEATHSDPFHPALLTRELVDHYRESQAQNNLTARSFERHLSALRKFSTYLRQAGHINRDPLIQEANIIADPWMLREFQNELYTAKASHLTIKNYINDVRQFVSFASNHECMRIKNLIDSNSIRSNSDSFVNPFSLINSDLLEQYRGVLVNESGLSHASVNRKLSSLRRYISFARSKGLVHSESLVSNLNPNTPQRSGSPLWKTEQKNSASANLASDKHAPVLNANVAPHQVSSISPASPKLQRGEYLVSGGDAEKQDKLNTKYQIRPYGVDSAPVVQNTKYSSFPPLRLAQKIGKLAVLGFDLTIVALAALALEKMSYLSWIAHGKQIFKVSAKNGLGLADKLKSIGQIPKNLPDELIVQSLGRNVKKDLSHSSKIILDHLPFHQKVYYHLRYTRPNWYKKYHSYPVVHYFHFAALIIIMSALGFGLYRSFVENPSQDKILASVPTAPPRVMSFQGRLTDASDNPITSAKDLRFAIYNDQTASGAALLWQETQVVGPDTDGIFSVLLGSSTTIPATVFTDNSSLYLGVTVQSDSELTPRQQIATVAFATNSETLQGLYPITAAGAGTTNVVLALDSSGNLTIGGSANPTFSATGGTFTLSGRVLTLSTTSGSNGNVNIQPDGQGLVNITKPIINESTTINNRVTTAAGAVEIDDLFAILATSSGQSAFTLNQNSTGPLISASTSGVAKFTVDNAGAGTFASNLAVNGGTISTTGDLTLSVSGNNVFFNDTTTFDVGGIAATAYNALSNSGGTPTNPNVTADNDLYVQGDIDIGGTLYLNGSQLTPGALVNYWQRNNGAVAPDQITNDLLLGAISTASAKFGFINVGSGTPTATISSNFSIQVPTGASPAVKVNAINGGSINFQTATTGQGDAGLTSRLFIKNDGNVGIGTASPDDFFKVSAPGGSISTFSGNASTSYITIGGTSSSGLFGVRGVDTFISQSAGNAVRIEGAGGNLGQLNTQHLSATGYATVSASLAVGYSAVTAGTGNGVFSGNVGIGTTVPAYKLDVVGTINSDSTFRIGGTGVAGEYLSQLTVSASETYLDYNGGLHIRSKPSLAGSTTENFTFTSGGNVGIGSTTPVTKLDVAGNANIQGYATASASLAIGYTSVLAGTGNGVFSGNVGIGSTLPGFRLDVSGGSGIVGQFSGRVIGGSAVNSNEFVTLSQLTGGTGQYWQRLNGTLSPTNITDDVLIGGAANATASALIRLGGTTNANSFFNTGGNVGIGTTAPAVKLEVQDGTAGSGSIHVARFWKGTTSGGAYLTLGTNADIGKIEANNDANTGGSLRFSTLRLGTMTEAARLTAEGNLGVGTTSPHGVFQVVGGTQGGNAAAIVNQTGATTNDIFTASASGTSRLSITNAGNIQFHSTSTSIGSDNTIYGSEQSGGALHLHSTSHATKGVIYFNSVLNSIDASSNLSINGDATFSGGNIGIGTGANSVAAIRLNGTSTLDVYSTSGSPTLTITNTGIGLKPTVAIVGNLNVSQYATVSASLAVGYTSVTAGTGNGVFSGNVGIGSSAPAARLDVNGNIQVQNSQWIGQEFFGLLPNNGSASTILRSAGNAVIQIDSDNDSTTSIFQIRKDDQTTGGTALVTVQEDGNVGIGTTSPTTKLEVSSALADIISSPNAFFTDTTSMAAGVGGGISFRGAYTGTTLTTGAGIRTLKSNGTDGNYNFDLAFYTRVNGSGSLSERMRIDSSGNVGIGSTAPVAKLDVAGNANIQGYATASASLAVGYSSVLAGTGNGVFSGNVGIGSTAPAARLDITGGNVILSDTAAKLFLDNGNTYLSRDASNLQILTDGGVNLTGTKFVFNTGNVGIGSTVPAAPLDVVGDIYASSGISLYNTAVSDDTVEAAKFCTGDGETNCVTDFSSLSTGAGYWQLNSNVLSPGNSTYDLAIGGTASTSAKFQVLALTNGTITAGTASTSGDLTFNGTSATQNINVLKGSRLDFRTSPGGDAGLASRISLTSNGNVGIGTTSPSDPLTVTSTSVTSSIVASLNNTSNNAALVLNSGGGNNPYIELRQAGTARAQFGYSATGYAYIGNGTVTDQLTVNRTTGNVGIGNTAPTTKLQVGPLNGTNIKLVDANGDLDVNYNNDSRVLSSANAETTFGASYVNLNGDGGIRLGQTGRYSYVIGGSSLLLQPVSGNVGIGTTTTRALLDINGATGASTSGILTFRGTTDPAINFLNGENLNFQSSPGGDSGLTSRLFINGNTGNIGAGTSSPLAKLTITGGDNSGGTNNTPAISFGYLGTNQYASFIRTRHNGATNVNNAIDFYTGDGTQNGVFPTNAIHNLTLNGGNVGVGSTTPLGKFNVDGAATGKALAIFNQNGGDQAVFTASVSGSTKFIINNSGNVGIGTTVPTYPLDVYSSARLGSLTGSGDGFVFNQNSITHTYNGEANPRFQYSRDVNPGGGDSGTLMFGAGGSTLAAAGGGIHLAAARNLAFSTSNGTALTERVRIDGSGNVGIGSTAPAAPLDVVGDIYGSSGISLYNTAVSDDTVEAAKFCTGDGETNCVTDFSTLVAGSSYWQRNSGALSPANITDDLLLGGTATSTAKFAFINNIGAGSPTASISSNLSLVVPTGSNPAAKINALNGGTLNLQTSPGGDAGLTSRVFLSSNGNVGIGSTSPTAAKLVVDNGANATYPLSLTSSSKFVRIGALNATYAHVDTDATSGFYFYDAVETGAGNNRLNISSGNSYLAATGGNVGIGTTAPGTKLQVGSTTNFRAGDDFTGTVFGGGSRAAWQLTDGTISVYSQVADRGYFGTLSNHMLTLQTNGTNRLGISAAGGYAFGNTYNTTDPGANNVIIEGNVGIGSTAPTSPLHVSKSSLAQGSTTNMLTLQGNYTGATPDDLNLAINFQSSDANYNDNPFAQIIALKGSSSGGNPAGQLAFWTKANAGSLTERLRIDAAGNVGIGTTAPVTKLDVAGNTNVQGYATASASLAVGYSSVLAGTGNGVFSGNVGIGTTTPAYRLHVSPATSVSFGVSNTGTNYPRLYMGGDSTTVSYVINKTQTTGIGYFGETSDSGGYSFRGSGSLAIEGALDANNTGTNDIAGTLNLSGNTLTSSGDLTINPTGGNVLFADTDTLQIGGVAAAAYNAISNSGGSPTNPNVTADNDLYVQGDVDIGGTLYVGGAQVGAQYWQKNSGVLSPLAITDDLTLGGTSTASALIKFTGTSGGNSFINTGNLGISTTSPVASLDVREGAVFRNAFSSSTPATPFASSSAEFLISSNSLVTIGESVEGNANPAVTLYRTTSGNKVGTAARMYLASSNFDFRIQQGTNAIDYGAETYTDRLKIDSGGGVYITSGLDVISASGMTIGTGTQTALTIGRAGATSTLNGDASSVINFTNFDVAATGNVTVAGGQGIDTNAAGVLAVGNVTATTVNIGNTAATALNLGAGGALTRTIAIGTGTGADTINIGTGATGADVITIGGGVGTLAINTGDWDISTTGALTGISGITTDGAYTQSGTGINYFSGNVGLGSTAPVAKFDVVGRIIGGFGADSTAGTLDWDDITNSRSGNGATLLLGNATNGPSAAGSNYFHPFNFEYISKTGSGNTTQLAIPYGLTPEQGIYMRGRYSGTWSNWMKIISENASGNVGIGTTAPIGKLNVHGAATGKALVIFNQNGGDQAIFTASKSGATKFLVDTNGNVGIGSTAPAAPLDVVGDIYASSGISLYNTAVSDDTVEAAKFCTGDGETNCVTDFSSLVSGSSYWQRNAGALAPGNITDDVLLGATATASAKIRLGGTTNADSFFNTGGNVGIGSTTPATKLDVHAVSVSEAVEIKASGLGVSGATGIVKAESGGGAWIALYGNNNNDQEIRTNTSENIHLSPGGTKYLTVLSGGNVGIGSTTPVALLDVTGSGGVFGTSDKALLRLANTDTTTTNNTTAIQFTANRTGGIQTPLASISAIMTNNGATTYTGALAFSTAGTAAIPTERLRIDGAGNVGIGSTAPAGDLDVVGGTLADGSFAIRPNATATAPIANTLGSASLAFGNNAYTAGSGPRLINLYPNTVVDGHGFSIASGLTEYYSNGSHAWYYRPNRADITATYTSTEVMNLNSAGNLQIDGDLTISGGNVTSATTFDSTLTATGTFTANGTLDANGLFTLGDNGDTGAIDTSDWDISTTGALTGISGITTDGAYTQSGSSLNSFSGNVGITTTNPVLKLQVGNKITDDNSRVYDTNAAMFVHQTPTSTTALNDPEEVLYLGRQGTSGQAYGAMAAFKLSRYENNSVNSRTRLDIDLTHGSFTDANVLTLLSVGNVGIGSTAPTAALDVVGAGKFSTDLTISGGDITGAGGAAIDIGEATSGDVEITGDLLPATDATYDLGSTTKSWRNAYLTGSLCFDDTDCMSASGGYWTRSAGNLYPSNLNDTISATTSASRALTITQTGAFDVLRFEDEASDTTPFVIDQAGNVGINTTTTSQRLNISGNVILTNTSDKLYLADGNHYITYDGTNTQILSASGGVNIAVNNAANFTVNTNSSERLRIDSAGNVGIGSTAPTAKLDILSYNGSNTFLSIDTDAATSSNILFKVNAANQYQLRAGFASGSFDIYNYNTSSSSLFINSSGNVGIGSTAPVTKLDVGGNANIQGYATASASLAVGYTAVTAGTGNGVFSGNVGIGTSTPGAPIDFADAVGDKIHLWSTSYGLGISSGEANWWSGGTFSFRTSSRTGTEIANLSAAGNLQIDGDLTISGGNVTSATTFDSTLTSTGVFSANNAGTNTIAGTLNLSGNTLTSSGDLSINPTGNNVLFSDTTTLQIGGATAVAYNAISNSGGTPTNPNVTADNDLYVQGDLDIGGTLYVGGTQVANYWQRNSGTLAPTNITDDLLLGGTSTTSALIKFTGTTAGNSYINTGNVGIGTTAPGGKLEIQRPNDSGVILRAGTADGQYFDFSRSSATGALSIQGNQVGNNNILLAPTSGNVGIGTTGPVSKAHIVGDTVALTLSRTSTSLGGLLAFTDQVNTVKARIGIEEGANNFIIDNGTSRYLTILNSNGNVGIGSTAPVTKLDVAGNTNIQGYATASASLAVGYSSVLAGTGNGVFSGNVGIGSSAPAARLDVNGTLTQTGGTANINASGTSATNIGNSTGALVVASGGTSSWTNTSGNLTIQTATSGTMAVDSAGALNLGTTNSTSTTLGKAATTLTVNPTSWTATPTISGLITATSGLTANGTLTANSTLDANGVVTLGDNGDTITLDSSDWDITAAGAMTGISGITNDGSYTQTGVSVNTFTGNVDATAGLDVTGASLTVGTSYSLTTGGLLTVEKLQDAANNAYYIDPAHATTSLLVNGNVGIGSTVPVAKLDVAGNTNIQGYATASASLAVGYSSVLAGTGNGAFSGNVGIGTSNPAARLQLSGSAAGGASIRAHIVNTSSAGAADGFAFNDGGKYAGFQIQGSAFGSTTYGISNNNLAKFVASADNLVIGQDANAPVAFVTNSTERIRIAANGNVGIGSTSPLGLLNVDGKATGKALTILNQNGGNQDVFTASISGVTKFTFANNGDLVVGGNDFGTATAGVLRTAASRGSNVLGANLTLQSGNGTGNAGSGDILFKTAPAGTTAVGVDSTSQSTYGTAVTSLTWSHTTAGANRALVVGVGYETTSTVSVTYNSVAMTEIGTVVGGAGSQLIRQFYLVNPDIGAHNVVVSFGTSNNAGAGAISLTGVDQTTPYVNTNTATGTSTTPSVIVTSATNDRVVSVMAFNDNTTCTPGASETEIMDITSTTSTDPSVCGDYEAGAASVTMSMTIASNPWAIRGTSFSPVAAATPLAFDERMRITSNGNVGIGSTAPSQKLDISGSTVISGNLGIGTTTVSDSNIEIANSGAVGKYINLKNTGTGGGNTYLQATNSNSSFGVAGFVIDDTNTSGSGAAFRLNLATVKLDLAGDLQIDATGTQTGNGVCHSGTDSDTTFADRDLVACTNTVGDVAEWYETKTGVEAADIVVFTDETITYSYEPLDPFTGMLKKGTFLTEKASILKKSQGRNEGRIAGVVSTAPYQTFGEAVNSVAQNPQPIGLTGRVPVKISSENGPIAVGDFITTSSKPGVGMKATSPGMVVGRAIEPYTNPDPNAVGKVMLYISTIQHDPTVQIAQSGNFNITGFDEGSFTAWAGQYKFENKGGFADAVIARLTAGIVKTQQLVVSGTATFLGTIQAASLNVTGAIQAQSLTASTIAVNNLSIGGQAINDYISAIVDNLLNTKYNIQNTGIVSPVATINHLNTGVISPLADDASQTVSIEGNVAIKKTASSSGNLSVEGNASVSGQLTASDARLDSINARQASIAGTLRAGHIIADTIDGLDARISSLAADAVNAHSITASNAAIANIYNIYNNGSGSATASSSGSFGDNPGASLIASSLYTDVADISSLSASLAYVPTLTSETATINQGLMVFGATSLADTSVTGQLSINGSLILAENSVNVLGGTFDIQPLRQGDISFEGGLVTIDTDGNVAINGNASFAKNVSVNGTLQARIISPVPSEDLVIQLPGSDATNQGTLAADRPGVTIKNGSGSAVLKITDMGDIIASGAALASEFQVVRGATADTSLTQTVATASAGMAIVKIGQYERTIVSPFVTDKSLIYITPLTDTNGIAPFIARQTAEDKIHAIKGSFTIRIPVLQPRDIKVNWWIVN